MSELAICWTCNPAHPRRSSCRDGRRNQIAPHSSWGIPTEVDEKFPRNSAGWAVRGGWTLNLGFVGCLRWGFPHAQEVLLVSLSLFHPSSRFSVRHGPLRVGSHCFGQPGKVCVSASLKGWSDEGVVESRESFGVGRGWRRGVGNGDWDWDGMSGEGGWMLTSSRQGSWRVCADALQEHARGRRCHLWWVKV